MSELKIKNLEDRVTEIEKRVMMIKDFEKDLEIPTPNVIRRIIDNSSDKYRDLMRISYLFGLEVSEMLPNKKIERGFFYGNDFSEVSIDGEDALLLKVPTIRQGGKPRTIAIPLNQKYEPWSKIILKLSEERANELLFDIVLRVFQEHVEKLFKQFKWIVPGKIRTTKELGTYWDPSHYTSFTSHNLIEMREYELGLCHNFNDLDFGIYFGTEYSSDYRPYFNKLLSKTDIYDNKDINEAIKLKNMVFNPREKEKYRFKEYLSIYKKIKRKIIIKMPDKTIPIDINIKPARKRSDSKRHQILKANVEQIIRKDKKMTCTFETDNFDVYAEQGGIVVECGQTDGRKLLDSIENVFTNIKNINEFWVLDFYDHEKNSMLSKFRINGK